MLTCVTFYFPEEQREKNKKQKENLKIRLVLNGRRMLQEKRCREKHNESENEPGLSAADSSAFNQQCDNGGGCVRWC